MPARLVRYVFVRFLLTLGSIALALIGAYLIIDFADRAHLYRGPHQLHDVGLLYACKALTVADQLAPAALLLAGGICASALRRRGEIVAMGSLAVRPAVVYVGILAGAFLAAGTMAALEELPVRADSPRALVGWAGEEVDTLMVTRFLQWGDFTAYYGPRQWFRGTDRIYQLRRQDGQGFADVTIYRLTPDFRLASRLDAARMHPLPDGTWRLEDGEERTFPAEDRSIYSRFQSRDERFPEDPAAFRLRPGRPEQLTHSELQSEIAQRKRLGLPTLSYRLALEQKVAHPLLGVPAALLAAGLALRRKRRGHLTTALIEGVAVVAVLGGVIVISRALATTGAISTATAAWTPFGLLSLASALALRALG